MNSANGNPAAIAIRNVSKRFGSFTAVDNVDISVPQGAFLVLVGPSGCGKSTLLRMFAGLETPTEGEMAFMGRTVSDGTRGLVADAGARDAGLVFQSYALWPHMTVAGNIEWPLKVAKWSKTDRAARVDEVLGLLGISALKERYPAEISGGQQQRVAIARTIGPKPSILLFDEPLSNLDAKLRIEMRSELMRIHRATGATSVYVTHDQVEAMAPDRVVVSDLGRARQTASLLGYGDAPLDPRLREIDMGNWTGRIKHELEAERPHEYLAWRAGTFTPDRGEPCTEFCARIVEGLRDCLRTCSGDTLAIVHGGVIRAARHAFLGLPPSRVVPVTPGTATILSFDAADAPTARLEAYNIAAVAPDFDAPD